MSATISRSYSSSSQDRLNPSNLSSNTIDAPKPKWITESEARSINTGWGGKHARRSNNLAIIAKFNWLTSPGTSLYHTARIFGNAFSRWMCAENGKNKNGKCWVKGGVSLVRKVICDQIVDGTIREWNGRGPTTAPVFDLGQFKGIETPLLAYFVDTLLDEDQDRTNTVKQPKTADKEEDSNKKSETKIIKESHDLRSQVRADFNAFLTMHGLDTWCKQGKYLNINNLKNDADLANFLKKFGVGSEDQLKDFFASHGVPGGFNDWKILELAKKNKLLEQIVVKAFLNKISHRARAAIARDYIVHHVGKDVSPAWFRTSAALNHACLTAVASNNRVEDLTSRALERVVMKPLEELTGITFMSNSQKRLLAHAIANSGWAAMLVGLGAINDVMPSPALIAAGFGGIKILSDNLALAPRLRNQAIKKLTQRDKADAQEDLTNAGAQTDLTVIQNQIRKSVHEINEALLMFDKVVEFENADFAYERMRAEPFQAPNDRDFAVNAMTKSFRSPGLNQSKAINQRLLQREVDNRLGQLLALADRAREKNGDKSPDTKTPLRTDLLSILETPLMGSGFQGAERLNLAESMDVLGVDFQTIKLYRKTLQAILNKLEDKDQNNLNPTKTGLEHHRDVAGAYNKHVSEVLTNLAEDVNYQPGRASSNQTNAVLIDQPDNSISLGIARYQRRYATPGIVITKDGMSFHPSLSIEQKSLCLEKLTQLTYLLPSDRTFELENKNIISAEQLKSFVNEESLKMAEEMFKPESRFNLAGNGLPMLQSTQSKSKIAIWKQAKQRMALADGEAWVSRAQLHLTIAYQAFDHKRCNAKDHKDTYLGIIASKNISVKTSQGEQTLTLPDFLVRARVAAQVMGEALCSRGSAHMPNNLLECDHLYLDRGLDPIRRFALKLEKYAYTASRILAIGGIISDNMVPTLGGVFLRSVVSFTRGFGLVCGHHKNPDQEIDTKAQPSPGSTNTPPISDPKRLFANVTGIPLVGKTMQPVNQETVESLKANDNYKSFEDHLIRSRTARTTAGGTALWSILSFVKEIPVIALATPLILAGGSVISRIAIKTQLLNAFFKCSAFTVSCIGATVGRSIGLAGLHHSKAMQKRVQHYQQTQANVVRFRQALTSYVPPDQGKAVDEAMAAVSKPTK